MRKTAFKKLTVLLIALILLVTPFSVSAAKAKIKNPIYKGTITVDGTIDEIWSAVEEVKLTFYILGDESSNASGYGKLLWDDDFVYVLGVVTDSTPTTAFREGVTEWNHDSFEIFLDETNEKIDKNSMTQFRISSLGRVSGQYLDTVVTEAQLKEHYPALKTAHKKTDTGYVVEFGIPWTRQTAPKGDSSKLGFCLQINDDVDNAGNEAEGIITTPVPSRFNPALYPTYTISSEKAKVEKEETSSKPSKDDGKTSSTDKTSSVTDADSKEETVSDNDSNTVVDDGSVSDSTTTNNNDNSQKADKDTAVSDMQMDMNAFMLIVLGAVIVLCLIGIILVYIFVLRASPKK